MPTDKVKKICSLFSRFSNNNLDNEDHIHMGMEEDSSAVVVLGMN